ncbi:MAG TPA: PAS domain-containing sensor histidine kinase, partial [Rubrivivax sp.]|nr:PAS domain-containing sensor histidine kinase [Rubrivivax sp.]
DEVEALTRRFRSVLDVSPVAMWITDGEHVAFANRAAQELFGVPAGEQLVGRSVYQLLQPGSHDAMRAQISCTTASAATPPVVSGTIARLDGETREVEIAAVALPDHGRETVQMVITDVTQRQQLAREQARHRDELRQLSASVVEAREEERRRIARELHDELGQRLTALKMELSSLGRYAVERPDDARIANMLEMVDDTVAALRRIAADLRPMMLDDLGLNAAIGWLARDAARHMAIEITLRLGEEDPPVADGAAIAIYRMVQEALTNVARHARATDVSIEMRQDGDELVLAVRDNGVGFPLSQQQEGGRYGLLGIRERAYMLGGRIEVDNPPGGGGRLTVRLPLARGTGADHKAAAP